MFSQNQTKGRHRRKLFFAILPLDSDVDFNLFCTRATAGSTFRCTPLRCIASPHTRLLPAILLPPFLRPSAFPKPDIGQEIPSDVSWEELRSTYLRNKSKVRVRKASSLPPSYGDAMDGGAGRSGSPGDRPPPPSYGPRDADNFTSQLSIGIPDGPSPSSFQSLRSSRSARPGLFGAFGSARRSVTSAASSGKSGNFGLSPGTRAVSARKAARDAQLSAERALAAAAMASRAADLAAQAALEVGVILRLFSSLPLWRCACWAKRGLNRYNR